MNKEIIYKLLGEKLSAKLAEKKKEVLEKCVKESVELQENHFSEDQLNQLMDKFEKEHNHEGIKAIESYLDAEANGNMGAAGKAAATIKRLSK